MNFKRGDYVQFYSKSAGVGRGYIMRVINISEPYAKVFCTDYSERFVPLKDMKIYVPLQAG